MNVRPISPDDAPAVATLAAADEAAVLERPSQLGPTDVLTWWEWVDLERDSWLFDDDGRVVAAGWFLVHGDIGMHAGLVAPDAKRQGLGAQLVARSEEAARGRGVSKLHTWALDGDTAAAALFGAHGYRAVRRFYEMAIELDAEPDAPALPEPLRLEPFREADAEAFHAATADAFQDHWEWTAAPFEEWWDTRRGQHADADGSLWFVIRDGTEIAAVIRNEANRNGGGYVGVLGVRKPWRGRGLGKALLYRTFAEFWRRGLPRVTLGVDAESPTGATKLYESVGMHVENATVVYEKAAT